MDTAQRCFTLTIACPDRVGIVAAVSGFLAGHGGWILEASHHADPLSRWFFMRHEILASSLPFGYEDLVARFGAIAEAFGMRWSLADSALKKRLVLLVSRQDHCLNDLLYRTATGYLPMEITSIVSNHTTWQRRAEHEGLPFYHLPITPENKLEQEAKLLAMVQEQEVDLIILARYMQVLSDSTCRLMAGRVINIHHSSLPAFKGARPYHRAYERGVKLVGATAHYVTGDLDEGPIIAQDTTAVDHADTVEHLIAQGQETESRVLTRAVKAHCEHRVMMNGHRTVVFR